MSTYSKNYLPKFFGASKGIYLSGNFEMISSCLLSFDSDTCIITFVNDCGSVRLTNAAASTSNKPQLNEALL